MNPATIKDWIFRNQEALLLATTLFLFTSKSLYNIPFGLMALLGLYRFIRLHASILKNTETRFYCSLFFSLWVPMVIAFIDPVDIGRCAQTVWPYLRFLLAGIYVFYGMRERDLRSTLETAFFLIITVWALDGVLQFLTGRDIFGYPYVNGMHITGMFYPDLTIGHALAGFSALYFDSLRQRSSGRYWIWLLLIPLFTVVFLCGRRSVWFMLAVNSFAYIGYQYYLAEHKKRFLIRSILSSIIVISVLTVLFVTQESVRQRVEKTMGLFSTDIESIDRATSHRIDGWRASWHMFQDNWLNGVGPRGHRFALQKYAEEDNEYYEIGQTHPHLVLLEIMAESGVIGLAGYVLFLYLVLCTAYRYRRNQTTFVCFIGIFAAAFPFNSHLAFYGSYWSSILWWMIIYLIINMYAVKTNRDKLWT